MVVKRAMSNLKILSMLQIAEKSECTLKYCMRSILSYTMVPSLPAHSPGSLGPQFLDASYMAIPTDEKCCSLTQCWCSIQAVRM